MRIRLLAISLIAMSAMAPAVDAAAEEPVRPVTSAYKIGRAHV